MWYRHCRFAWGSNKHGRLGFSGVDSVSTPRRLNSFKHEIVAVAAANKHSAGLSASGRLYTWGDNTQGQLGYGTSGKAFHSVPRIVESIKDRHIISVSASKRHTVVLTSDGDVLAWGHKVLPPTKVCLHGCRDTARSAKAIRLLTSRDRRESNKGGGIGNSVSPYQRGAATGTPRPRIHFHRDNADVTNPRVVAIAAGATHTSMLTSSGVVLAFRSEDPAMMAQEVEGVLGSMSVVKIAAGKSRSVALTDTGEVYTWMAPAAERLRGVPPPADAPPVCASFLLVMSCGSCCHAEAATAVCTATCARRLVRATWRLSVSPCSGTPSELVVLKRRCHCLPAIGSGASNVDALHVRTLHHRTLQHSKRPEQPDPHQVCLFAAEAPSTESPAVAADARPQAPFSCHALQADSIVVHRNWIKPQRVQGLRRAVAIAVGEKHSVALQGVWVPKLPQKLDMRVLVEDMHGSAKEEELSPQSSSDSGDGPQGGRAGRSIEALAAIALSPPMTMFASNTQIGSADGHTCHFGIAAALRLFVPAL
jgi:hypothetical protein